MSAGHSCPGRTSRLSKSARCRRRHPTVESLEGRSLLSTSTVNLISENDSGTNGATLGASLASVSADGQYVAFEGVSYTGSTTPAPSDLVAGLTVQNNATNIYVRDTATNKTTCISLDLNGNLTGNDNSIDPVISANGETVVFLSNATDLTANDNLREQLRKSRQRLCLEPRDEHLEPRDGELRKHRPCQRPQPG